MDKSIILFVDQDKALISSLKRSMRHKKEDWDCYYCSSVEDAKAILKEVRPNIIVSDSRVTSLHGKSFIEEVRELSPDTLRIVMSGQVDAKSGLKSLQAASRCLNKPCTIEELQQCIDELCSLDKKLGKGLITHKIASLRRLPTLPDHYFQIENILRNPQADIRDISLIIEQDPAMAAKILQVASSAYFAPSNSQIKTIQQGIIRLGIQVLRSLVLGVQAFKCFDPSSCPNFKYQAFWEDSLNFSYCVRNEALKQGLNHEEVETHTTAGLLYGIGKLVMATVAPIEYSQFLARRFPPEIKREEEQKFFGTTYNKIGAYLIGTWGLDKQIVQLVATPVKHIDHIQERLPSACIMQNAYDVFLSKQSS